MKKRFSLLLSSVLFCISINAKWFTKDKHFEVLPVSETEVELVVRTTSPLYSYSHITIPSKVEVWEDGLIPNDPNYGEPRVEGVFTVVDVSLVGCENLESITLPSTMKTSGKFENCKKLKSINLPNNVTTVTSYAFAGCESLESVSFPSKLESIKDRAFNGCVSLKSADLSSCHSLKSIGSEAFKESGLEKITLPNILEKIDMFAFQNCDKLEFVKLNNRQSKLQSIGESAFDGCSSLRLINNVWTKSSIASLPMKLEEIKNKVFQNCAFSILQMPEELKTIGYRAFGNCVNLVSVDIPDQTEQIYNSAFEGCVKLKNIYLSESLTGISGAFINCPKIDGVYADRVKPFSITFDTFDDAVYQNATLYVDKKYKSDFEKTYAWSRFEHIYDKGGDWRWTIYVYDITATGNGSVVIDPRTDFLSADGDYYAIRWDFDGITIRNDQEYFDMPHKPLTGVTIKLVPDKGYKVKQVLYAASQKDEFVDVTSEIKPSGNGVYELFVEDKGSYPRFIVTFGKEGEDSSVLGDLTGDNKVDNADLEKVLTLIMNGEYETNADLNVDGVVNVADVVELVKIINSGNGTGSGYFWMGNYNPNSNNFPTLNGKEVEGIVTTYTSLDDAMAKASRVYTAGEWAVVIYPSSWGVKDDLVFLDSVNKKYYEAKQKYLPDFPDNLYYESTERIGANATITLSTEGVAKAAGATLSSSIIQ